MPSIPLLVHRTLLMRVSGCMTVWQLTHVEMCDVVAGTRLHEILL